MAPKKRRRTDNGTQGQFKIKNKGQREYSLTVTKPLEAESLLQKLAELKFEHAGTKSRQLCELEFEYEYDDDTQHLTFNGTDEVEVPGSGRKSLNSFLANLKSLSFTCCPLQCFQGPVMLPECKDMSFDHSGGCSEGGLDFVAPKLESISFQHCTYLCQELDATLSASLSKSPRLEQLASYKLWGVEKLGPLYLPSIKVLDFYRSDSLSSLKVYAPRMERLVLRAAYAIKNVHLLVRGSKDHKGLENEDGEQLNMTKDFSKFTLDVINVCLPQATCEKWAKWPRLRKVVWECEADGFPIDNCSEDDGDAASAQKERDNRARWIQAAGEPPGGCSLM